MLVNFRYYFRNIEEYMKESSQLTQFLANIREKYSEWLENSPTTVIVSKSVDGTLCGTISEVYYNILGI